MLAPFITMQTPHVHPSFFGAAIPAAAKLKVVGTPAGTALGSFAAGRGDSHETQSDAESALFTIQTEQDHPAACGFLIPAADQSKPVGAPLLPCDGPGGSVAEAEILKLNCSMVGELRAFLAARATASCQVKGSAAPVLKTKSDDGIASCFLTWKEGESIR